MLPHVYYGRVSFLLNSVAESLTPQKKLKYTKLRADQTARKQDHGGQDANGNEPLDRKSTTGALGGVRSLPNTLAHAFTPQREVKHTKLRTDQSANRRKESEGQIQDSNGNERVDGKSPRGTFGGARLKLASVVHTLTPRIKTRRSKPKREHLKQKQESERQIQEDADEIEFVDEKGSEGAVSESRFSLARNSMNHGFTPKKKIKHVKFRAGQPEQNQEHEGQKQDSNGNELIGTESPGGRAGRSSGTISEARAYTPQRKLNRARLVFDTPVQKQESEIQMKDSNGNEYMDGENSGETASGPTIVTSMAHDLTPQKKIKHIKFQDDTPSQERERDGQTHDSNGNEPIDRETLAETVSGSTIVTSQKKIKHITFQEDTPSQERERDGQTHDSNGNEPIDGETLAVGPSRSSFLRYFKRHQKRRDAVISIEHNIVPKDITGSRPRLNETFTLDRQLHGQHIINEEPIDEPNVYWEIDDEVDEEVDSNVHQRRSSSDDECDSPVTPKNNVYWDLEVEEQVYSNVAQSSNSDQRVCPDVLKTSTSFGQFEYPDVDMTSLYVYPYEPYIGAFGRGS